MKERDFQARFRLWAKQDFKKNAAFELKYCKNTYLPFANVTEGQIDALLRVKHKGLYYKISDLGVGYKPFDCFKIKGHAYVAIMYEKLRSQHKHFYLIDIDTFVKESKESIRRSLIEGRANQIGEKIYL